MGEKEPRINWLVVVIGVLTLGGGYFIAVWVKDSVMAIAFYFVAVFLVIIGTYCLFTSLSILALKALKKNKRYYYKSKHFISVSGMLYRMKRNGVGLANICIIATMVMVMISGTLSLYLGCGEVVRLNTPTDIVAQGRHYFSYSVEESTPEEREVINPDALNSYVLDRYAEAGAEPTSGYQVEYLEAFTQVAGSNGQNAYTNFYILTADTYAAITGEDAPVLGEGETLALVNVPGSYDTFMSGFRFQGYDSSGNLTGEQSVEFHITGECRNILNTLVRNDALLETGEDNYVLMVVDGTDTLNELGQLTKTGAYYWEGRYNFAQLSDSEQLALNEAFWSMDNGAFDFSAHGCGYVSYFSSGARVSVEQDVFGMSGGFLFLGVFLGLVFMMAAVLIIYYKQVSEGYEDQRRFDIMRKVGLSRREARRSIRSQILTVFFLPLIVAAVHIAFDFKLVLQLLTLFALRNTTLTALCTLGTLAVFCLIYALVYMLTARAYYKIVDARPQESRS